MKKKVLFFICITLYSFGSLHSQNYQWRSSGPYIDLIASGITYYFSDPDIMLAGANGVLYKSTNGGETWSYYSFYDGTLNCIQIDPNNDNIVYLGLENGIIKSEDDGKTWQQTGQNSGYINSIAIDKNNSNIIFIGAGENYSSYTGELTGILKSTDAGQTWNHVFTKPTDGVNNIIIDHNNSSIILAGMSTEMDTDYRMDKTFLKSTDAGETWNEYDVTTSWYSGCYSLTQSPVNTNDLYCISVSPGNHRDVYRSTNKGNTWESIFIYYFDGPVKTVITDPENENIIYAYGADLEDELRGLYKSTNKGNTWTKLQGNIPSSMLHLILNQDQNFTITSNEGIFKSNFGSNWVKSLCNAYITDITIHPQDDNIAFAAAWGEKIFKTLDGNGTWELESSVSRNDKIIAISPSDPNNVSAASGRYVHKSTDGGNTFSNQFYSFMSCGTSQCDSYPEEMLYHPNNSSRIIIGTSGVDGVLAMSSNGGSEWGFINFAVSSFVFNPNDFNMIFAGSKNNGVYRIEDIWTTTLNLVDLTGQTAMGNVNNIAVTEGLVLFAAADNGLWKFDQSTWSKLTGLPDDIFTSVALDNFNNFLYAGTENNGVFLSTNLGVTWNEFNNGLTDFSITKLELSDSAPNLIYAGTKHSGVWTVDHFVGIENEFNQSLSEFKLSQNYPNPFNPSTIISYQIPANCYVNLKVFDLLGREIVTLVKEYQRSGSYEIVFNASLLSSGVYIYRLEAGKFSEEKKMVLIR
ncbi:MAG: T9SS type A sorting domain-containing protein [Melioribacteraceae bacterium]|nr:T9SS type A sorting domain-containing protein [Melioribacteraceae bacterium]